MSEKEAGPVVNLLLAFDEVSHRPGSARDLVMFQKNIAGQLEPFSNVFFERDPDKICRALSSIVKVVSPKGTRIDKLKNQLKTSPQRTERNGTYFIDAIELGTIYPDVVLGVERAYKPKDAKYPENVVYVKWYARNTRRPRMEANFTFNLS
jgi:hypothetical protein